MAEFRIDQTGGAGTGVAGQSRFDLLPGVAVTLVATAPVGVGVSYAWEIVDAVNTTGTLSAASGSMVAIAAPGIVANSGFRVRLTANDNGIITTTDRVFGVRSTYAAIRPPLFGEQAPATQTLGLNYPDLSTDNALYPNLAGRGVPGQNPFGWREWGWEITKAIEQTANGLANLPPPPVTGNVFVYDAGAPLQVDNLYNDWATLYAAASAIQSSVTIELRSDLTIPTGAYSLYSVLFRGEGLGMGGGLRRVIFDDATLLTASYSFEFVQLEWTNAGSPLVGGDTLATFRTVFVSANSGGVGALFDVGVGTQFLALSDGLSINTGALFANVGATAQISINADNFISMSDPVITGHATSSVFLLANTASSGFGSEIPTTLPSYAGSYTYLFANRAAYLGYDDTVVTPPSLGSTVQDAIDALKTLAMYPTVGPVIWRDGAATQGNVFGSWSALYTYLSAAPAGQREVIVDNTLTTFPQIPAGTWNLSHWKIRGAIEWVPYLQINNGAYFTFDYNAGLTLENLWTNVLATTAPTITKAADSGIFKLTVIGGWIDVSGGTKPFFDGTSGTGNVNITIDNARLIGAQGVDSPDVPVLKFGASVIYNELILDRYADVYNPYALWSTDGNVTTKILSAAVNLPVQANYTSATYVNQELAYQVAYDDTLVNPLLSATDVQGAIDALKGQLLGSGSGGGIYRIAAGVNYSISSGFTGIEMVVGGFVYQPGTDTPIKLEALGSFTGNFTVNLYDVGSPGSGGSAPVLRATLPVTVTSGYGSGVLLLTPTAVPAVNGEISTAERFYEVRVVATSIGTLTWAGLKIGTSGS